MDMAPRPLIILADADALWPLLPGALPPSRPRWLLTLQLHRVLKASRTSLLILLSLSKIAFLILDALNFHVNLESSCLSLQNSLSEF